MTTTAAAQFAQAAFDALVLEVTGARTVREVAEAFVGPAAQALGAASARLYVLDADDVLRSVAWTGRGADPTVAYDEVALSSPLPGAVAVREHRPLHYRCRDEIVAAFPALAAYYPEERTLHVLPLSLRGAASGLVALSFPVGVVGTPDHERLLESLAQAMAGVVARARELELADAALARSQLLAEASGLFVDPAGPEELLDALCAQVVPRLADWCTVQLLEGGSLRLAALRHRDPATSAWAWDLRDAFPTRMDRTSGAPQVVRTGISELYEAVPAGLVDSAAVDDEHRVLLRRLGIRSGLTVPLHGADGAPVGAVTLIQAESERRFTVDDLRFVEELAGRASTALVAARRSRAQSVRLAEVTRVAEAAQLAILAPPPARIGPVQLAARYRSASSEAKVGGDLYEVVASRESVRLIVGDVCGKGLAAVRTATVVLGEFRAAAAEAQDVAAVARQIDERLRVHLDDHEYVTACLVDISLDGTVAAVSCGHPRPVLLPAARAVDAPPAPAERPTEPATEHARLLGAVGDVLSADRVVAERRDGQPREVPLPWSLPLGLGSDPEIHHAHLRPGDRLLLYTDALIEARRVDGSFVDPVVLWGEAVGGTLDEALDRVVDRLHAEAGQDLGDDLALLVAAYDPAGSGSADDTALRRQAAALVPRAHG